MNKVIRRTRQLWRALTAKMTAADHTLVSRYLNKTEKNLFFQMDVAVQKHCVNVAYTLEELLAIQANTPGVPPGPDTTLLYKAALLHDIGKITGRFTVLDRIWFVLVRKVSRRLANRIAKKGCGGWLTRLRNAFYIHIHHGALGSDLARQNGFPDELIMLIRHHHDRGHPDDSSELKLLRQADELN
jgi:putative nucleotidyltransferase with HDIG domain